MGIHLSDFLQDNLALMGHPVSFFRSKKILWVHSFPLQPFKPFLSLIHCFKKIPMGGELIIMIADLMNPGQIFQVFFW
jgi:hypothetical protein